MADAIEAAVAALPRHYPGPGGAAAVLREGRVLARHAWGFANAERRIPFTPRTLFRVCSITKQFTCVAMLDAFPEPAVLDGDLRALLPRLEGAVPSVLHLAHNQAGLRDYWAVAMLHGSPVEAPFGDAEAAWVIGGTRSLHFAPGTRYSYVNQNFRLISALLEARAGRGFAEILRGVTQRAGMETAFLAADTRAMPDGTEGYEGSVAAGFRAAENRILWTGDAGLGASLDDMIAWERFIDAGRDDADGLVARLHRPARFADGAPAAYGFGLRRGQEFGRIVVGHGGALRGWRSHRLYMPAERVSVVVLFNHMADAHAAALDLLGAALGAERAAPEPRAVPQGWVGAWLEPETMLAARIDPAGPGQLRLRFGHSAEVLGMQADGSATNGATVLRMTAEGLCMERAVENQIAVLRPRTGLPRTDIDGHYRCAELGAELTIADAGGAIFGGFSGFLGQGRMEMLEPIAEDLWALPCPRALDHTPPGDWTLLVRRDGAGRVEGITLGCWLARRLEYRRVAG